MPVSMKPTVSAFDACDVYNARAMYDKSSKEQQQDLDL